MEFLEIVTYKASNPQGEYQVTNDPYSCTGYSKSFPLVLMLLILSNKNLALSKNEFRGTRKNTIKS